MKGRIPKKNIPNVQLVTKQITRRNDVGKAQAHLKPKNLKLDDSKTDETPTSTSDVPNKQTTSIIKNPKN